MTDLYEHKWDNRTEEGLDLAIDGYGEVKEIEPIHYTESATYKSKLEHEPDLEQ